MRPVKALIFGSLVMAMQPAKLLLGVIREMDHELTDVKGGLGMVVELCH